MSIDAGQDWRLVSGLAIQGRNSHDHWVSEISVQWYSWSDNGYVDMGKKFGIPMNYNGDEYFKVHFDTVVYTRYIKIIVNKFHSRVSMRAGLLQPENPTCSVLKKDKVENENEDLTKEEINTIKKTLKEIPLNLNKINCASILQWQKKQVKAFNNLSKKWIKKWLGEKLYDSNFAVEIKSPENYENNVACASSPGKTKLCKFFQNFMDDKLEKISEKISLEKCGKEEKSSSKKGSKMKNCKKGYWGPDCKVCGKCFGGRPCNMVTGKCESGKCEEGWFHKDQRSQRCDQRIVEQEVEQEKDGIWSKVLIGAFLIILAVIVILLIVTRKEGDCVV